MTLDEAFARPPTFTTERLTIRPLKASDAEAIFSYKGDPKVTEQYGLEPHPDLDATRRWVRDRLAGPKKRQSIYWVYALKGETRSIGSCVYWHLDEESRCAEIGYELGRPFWHRGITSEALAPVLAFGFDGMELNRIEADPLADNIASNRLLLKLGFRLEGTLRERVHFRGRYFDQNYYGLLKGELKAAGPP